MTDKEQESLLKGNEEEACTLDFSKDQHTLMEDGFIKVEDAIIIEPPLVIVECNLDFYCQSCDVEYDNVTALINHYVFTHPDSPELQKIRAALSVVLNKHDDPVKELSHKLHCKCCNLKCDDLKSLIKHIALTHPASVESDKICNFFYGYDKTWQLSGVPMANLNSTDFMEMKNFCNNIFGHVRKRLKVMPMCNSDSKSKESKENSNFRCEICLKYYPIARNLAQHNKECYSRYRDLENLIPCNECKILFKSCTYLDIHYKFTHGEHTFGVKDLNKINKSINCNDTDIKTFSLAVKCKECKVFFKKPSSLWYHYRTLHGQYKKYNDIFLQFYSSYRFHKNKDVPETVSKQNKVIQDISVVITDSITHAANEKLIDALRYLLKFGIICNICLQCCNTSSALLKHHKAIHSTTKLELAIECYECKKEFKTAAALWNHYKFSHPNMVFTLTNLEKVCSISYYNNIEVADNEENENTSENHILHRLVVHVRCYECNTAFNTPSSLWSHYHDVHVDKAYNFDDVFIQFYRIL